MAYHLHGLRRSLPAIRRRTVEYGYDSGRQDDQTGALRSSKITDKAPDTATRFFDSVVRLHGMPHVIVSDRDTKFTSMFWRALMSRFGTRLAMFTGYHPQTDGQSEVMVRALKEMLRHYLSHNQKDWTQLLSALEFAYNNSINASTGLTPFELDLGYHPVTLHTAEADLEVAAAES
jgi:hypothetical protein